MKDSKRTQRVLITGGAGFIGSHTADLLLERGYEVRALDILDPQVHGESADRPAYLDPRVELLRGDIRDRADVERALEGIDAVYHLASLTGVGQSMHAIHAYSDVNINGTAMLLDVLANSEHSVERIILSSSRAVYGEGKSRCANCGVCFPKKRSREQLAAHRWETACPKCERPLEPLPTDEEKPFDPISVYALTKQVQEEMIRSFGETYGMSFVILRYFNVYGPRQALDNPYTGIGAIFTSRALSGENIPIYEDGLPGRDFVHVRDVVRANLLALEKTAAADGTFNVGTGERLTVVDLARSILDRLESSAGLDFTQQFRIGDVRDCHADLTRSREVLGYRPEVSFAQGVGELIEWARGEGAEGRPAESKSGSHEHA